MKKKIIIILGIFILLIISFLIFFFSPSKFCKYADRNDIFLEIRDGTTGKVVTITNEKEVSDILNIIKGRTYYKKKLSLGYMGTHYTITVSDDCKTFDKFIVNSENEIRKDPFFYTCEFNNGSTIIDKIDEYFDDIDITNENFVNSVIQVICQNNKIGRNGELIEQEDIIISDINKIQKFFNILLNNVQECKEIPYGYTQMLLSSQYPYPNGCYCSIVLDNGITYDLIIANGDFSFNDKYYTSNCKIETLKNFLNEQ